MNKKSLEKTKKEDIAISVKNVSKEFRIPHEKITSLKGVATSAFKKKTYEEFNALDDVSFDVRKGEFFGIIGRNGSGKSTLLKIIAGIYQADEGVVDVDGRISPFLELGIGFNPELSGRDNIYLNATVLGMSKKEIDEKFDSIVKFSELERFIDQKLKNYSSGMKVRLAFSVSIHANRDILLMDEVLAVGDTNFQAKCLREFNKYRDLGRTVIIVTHDILVVERYCNRALLLRNGKIVKIGKASDVANEYVYENVNDEEVSFSVNGNNTSHESAGYRKDVRILKVSVLDVHGEEKNIFEIGDDINIKIDYKINREIDEVNFGIGLHAIEGGQVLGYSTDDDDFSVSNNEGEGSISMKLNKTNILRGEYYINAICFGENRAAPHDLILRCGKIKFFTRDSRNRYRGFLDVKHFWEEDF